MTPTQIELIRTSWAAVEPTADVAATLFYERLFEMDPAVRRLVLVETSCFPRVGGAGRPAPG